MSSSSDDFVNGIKLRGDGSVDDNSGSDIYGDDLDNDLRVTASMTGWTAEGEETY